MHGLRWIMVHSLIEYSVPPLVMDPILPSGRGDGVADLSGTLLGLQLQVALFHAKTIGRECGGGVRCCCYCCAG